MHLGAVCERADAVRLPRFDDEKNGSLATILQSQDMNWSMIENPENISHFLVFSLHFPLGFPGTFCVVCPVFNAPRKENN